MRDLPLARALVAVAILLSAVACGTTEQSPLKSATPVQAAPNPKLVEFEQHVADAVTREGQLVRALAAASVGSQDRLGLAARQLDKFAVEELAWLDDHAGDPCYEPAKDAFAKGLNSLQTSAAKFSALATAAAPPSDAEGQAAGQALADGTDAINQAAALAESARAACR